MVYEGLREIQDPISTSSAFSSCAAEPWRNHHVVGCAEYNPEFWRSAAIHEHLRQPVLTNMPDRALNQVTCAPGMAKHCCDGND